MVASVTLERFIKKCDEVVDVGNINDAKDLQEEILAVFEADLDGLKNGLTNYAPFWAFTSSRTGKTVTSGNSVDYIKDIKTLRSRLIAELEKITEANTSAQPKNMINRGGSSMGIMQSCPRESITLYKQSKEIVENIQALVMQNRILVDDASIIIEEEDFIERSLSNGAKEYYKVTDRGFCSGSPTITAHYQLSTIKINRSEFERSIRMAALPKACVEETALDNKPNKLFISHSSKDKEYMMEFVDLLEKIGVPDESIVCTSIPGRGIPGSAKIYDWLREQFTSCNLRVVFALSSNYYRSPACLNEMGAAWITRTTYTLLLLPGFDFSDIQGCIDPTSVGIKLDDDEAELKYRLTELKNTLINEYSLRAMDEIKWERYRDAFISRVREIAKKTSTEE